MTIEELKPCPFCGGKAKPITGWLVSPSTSDDRSVRIECIDCGCTIPFRKNAQDAWFYWNRRTRHDV